MSSSRKFDRRTAIAVLSSLGSGSSVFRRALAKDAEKQMVVTVEMIAEAEWVAGTMKVRWFTSPMNSNRQQIIIYRVHRSTSSCLIPSLFRRPNLPTRTNYTSAQQTGNLDDYPAEKMDFPPCLRTAIQAGVGPILTFPKDEQPPLTDCQRCHCLPG